MAVIDPERRAALAAAKLAGLVSGHLDSAVGEPSAAGSAAAIVVGSTAWVYQPHAAADPLGSAIVWAAHHQCDEIGLIVDEPPPLLVAGLAGCRDGVRGFVAEGRGLRSIDTTEVFFPDEPARPSFDHPLVDSLRAEGLEIVPEHGAWLGEVLGLEVARVSGDDAAPVVALGVGAYDRGAFEALYPDDSPLEALPRVVALVREHRAPGAPPHLLNRLVHERWLRAAVMAAPAAVGAVSLDAIAGLAPRPGLHEVASAAAIGATASGSVLMVSGAGIDPGLISSAAGLVARYGPDRVVLVLAAGDRHPAIVGAARYLGAPADVVEIAAPWAL